MTSINFEIQPISFSRIDWSDATYRTTYDRPVGYLIHSIETIGLQHLPILQEREQGCFCIVSGYRRLRSLQKIGRETVSCKIVAHEIEENDLFLLNVHDNCDRGFNSVEQSFIIKRLASFIEERELIQRYLPLLNLPPKKEIFERFLRVFEMSPIYRPALMQGRLFPETIESVIRDFLPLAHRFFALFIFFHWGLQKQKEFLTELKEICIRGVEEPEKFLSTSMVTDLMQRPTWTPQQKGQALRKFFRTCRYPTLTDTEKTFESVISPLNLDQRIRIQPPPFFEGGRYGLEIDFSSPKELKGFLERITKVLEEGKLDDLP